MYACVWVRVFVVGISDNMVKTMLLGGRHVKADGLQVGIIRSQMGLKVGTSIL